MGDLKRRAVDILPDMREGRREAVSIALYTPGTWPMFESSFPLSTPNTSMHLEPVPERSKIMWTPPPYAKDHNHNTPSEKLLYPLYLPPPLIEKISIGTSTSPNSRRCGSRIRVAHVATAVWSLRLDVEINEQVRVPRRGRFLRRDLDELVCS
jgi:hypothetical protein